jgi:hypothetical protein
MTGETWILLLQLITGGIGVLDMPSEVACLEAVEKINTAPAGILPLLRLHDGTRIPVVRAIECRPPAIEGVPAS